MSLHGTKTGNPTDKANASARRRGRVKAAKVGHRPVDIETLWKRGADLRRDIVERACEVLGIEVPERSAAGVLTIAGGRWDGVAITLREEESLNTIVSRLLAALRSR